MSGVFCFVALPAEAKPLIRRWGLQKISGGTPFPLYRGPRHSLAISGVGQINAAAALGYAMAAGIASSDAVFLNIGIAGSRDRPLGSLLAADKIVNAVSGKTFYPQFPFKSELTSCELISAAAPVTDYPDPHAMYDMEAAAFYETAVKFNTCELIHCLKIISDNRLAPPELITENLAMAAIEGQLPAIEQFLARLTALSRNAPDTDDPDYSRLLATYPLSASNTVKLKKLLQTLRLLQPDVKLDEERTSWRNGKDLIAWLERAIAQHPFRY